VRELAPAFALNPTESGSKLPHSKVAASLPASPGSEILPQVTP
jgi:hypothetical protein